MLSHRLASTLDYNRGLPAFVRWVRAGCALAGELMRFALGWAFVRGREWWAVPGLMIALALIFVLPRDAQIRAFVQGLRLAGDVKRELETLQQFGQAALSIVIGLAIFALDPLRRRRLLDWLAGALVLGLCVNLVKAFVGRPRPLLNDATHAAGPLGYYMLSSGDTGRQVWRFASGWTSGYDLASMPSRHAAFATLACVFLWFVYPRVRVLALVLTLIVCAARVITDAHWASDVIIGAALGLGVALPTMRGYWGVRSIDWLWRRLIDPKATPALERVMRAEGVRG